MRVVFIGVVTVGWHCLKALLESKADVVGIFTANKQKMVKKSGMHPDYFSEFGDLALEYGVPLHKIDDVSIRLDTTSIKELQPDIIFCIGWPQIIRRDILQIPTQGCVGFHPALLPERRGGAPINWSLIDGLTRSGVTLFYMDEGVDSGDIIAQRTLEIAIEDTAKSILGKVGNLGIQILKEYYPLIEKGKAPRISQDGIRATYTRRRHPEDGIIDWSKTSFSIYNWIRALTLPFPGAFTYWNGEKIIIWASELLRGYKARFNAQPGEVLEFLNKREVIVATGDNCILIKDVEGGGKFKIGTILGGEKYGESFSGSPTSR